MTCRYKCLASRTSCSLLCGCNCFSETHDSLWLFKCCSTRTLQTVMDVSRETPDVTTKPPWYDSGNSNSNSNSNTNSNRTSNSNSNSNSNSKQQTGTYIHT